MKKRLTVILLTLIPVSVIFGQQPIIVSEDSLSIGKSILPGLSVTIPEANYETVLKAWIKNLQAGTKSDVVTENEEMTIFGAKLKAISPNPLNVYSKLTMVDSILMLYVSLETKKDVYIEQSTSNAEYLKVQDYIKNFSKEQYIDVAGEQLEAEERKLRDLQKELSSLENEKSKMLKSIQSDDRTLLDEKDNIIIQNNELKTVEASLKEQRDQLAGMEDGPAQKAASDKVKELEKRKKKALNSIDASENKIKKAENSKEDTNKAIPGNEESQQKIREQIIQQQAVCQKYSDKLDKIKLY